MQGQSSNHDVFAWMKSPSIQINNNTYNQSSKTTSTHQNKCPQISDLRLLFIIKNNYRRNISS